MASFRHTGAVEAFPWEFEGPLVWYGIIQPGTQRNWMHRDFRLIDVAYTSNVSGKRKLWETLVSHRAAGFHADAIKVFGIWTGQWTTDLFVFPRDEAIVHLDKVLGQKGKKR